MSERTGGCLCGAVRYRLTADPLAAVICWCRDCQRIASNGTVNAIVRSETLAVSGEMSEYRGTAASGSEVRRRFCSRCGSHLFGNSTSAPGLTAVSAGTLDDPSSITPATNLWSASAPVWACLNPALDRVERQ